MLGDQRGKPRGPLFDRRAAERRDDRRPLLLLQRSPHRVGRLVEDRVADDEDRGESTLSLHDATNPVAAMSVSTLAASRRALIVFFGTRPEPYPGPACAQPR